MMDCKTDNNCEGLMIFEKIHEDLLSISARLEVITDMFGRDLMRGRSAAEDILAERLRVAGEEEQE